MKNPFDHQVIFAVVVVVFFGAVSSVKSEFDYVHSTPPSQPLPYSPFYSSWPLSSSLQDEEEASAK